MPGGPRIAPHHSRRRRDYSEEASDYTDGLVLKYGSKDQALRVLGTELFEIRQDRRKLREENTALKEENEALKAKINPTGN